MMFYSSSVASSLEYENVINIETSISDKGLPTFEIFGLISRTIEESKKRIINSFESMESSFPLKNISINLSPAEINKEGTHFDLAIAATIMQFTHGVRYDISNTIFIGELSFDGRVRGVFNIIYLVLTAKKLGFKKFFISKDNLSEVAFLSDIDLYPITNLKELIKIEEVAKYKKINNEEFNIERELSFYKIIGNVRNKRIISIALAGKHHLLLTGYPGSGKSLLAKSAVELLPDLEFDQALEVSKLYSFLGVSRENKDFYSPPFRSPHCTSSYSSVFGSLSKNLVPGELSLSNHGILFLDELPEFNRLVLEGLRSPLEDKKITISRAKNKKILHCDFILIGAMNPCKCGYFNHKKIGCKCTPIEIKRYQNRISGPILDRVDINIFHEGEININENLKSESKNYSFEELQKYKTNIKRTREFLKKDSIDNSVNYLLKNLGNEGVQKILNDKSINIVKSLQENYSLSNRRIVKLLNLAKTISIFDEEVNITPSNILEALSLSGVTS